MLHIHNGDAAAEIALRTSLSGEQFTFREALIDGPTTLTGTGDSWSRMRARHLSSEYQEELDECEKGLREQQQKLASFSDYDEVVLWFEHDLFCQLNLIYLLDWFAARELRDTKLSLICIGEFPGRENFRGLGELTPEELASLFPARTQVTQQQLSLATSAWTAYCSDNPTDLQRFLKTDCSSLPFLSDALRLHLQRFPSTTNGLGRIENTALRLINGGATSFQQLFSRFAKTEALYGLGDAQLWLALKRMLQVRQALITISGDAGMEKGILPTAVFDITAAGKAVLNAETDFVEVNGIDTWLGGVHLSGSDNVWRWDESSKTLVRR